MRRVRQRLGQELPQLSAYFQSGGLVDSVLNMGMPAPIDVQVSGNSLTADYRGSFCNCGPGARSPGVSDVLIPQDIDYPALQLDIDREKASLVGLSPERSRGQRHHRPHFQRHDCAKLLDRSEERESVHADCSIPGNSVKTLRGSEADSNARKQEQ